MRPRFARRAPFRTWGYPGGCRVEAAWPAGRSHPAGGSGCLGRGGPVTTPGFPYAGDSPHYRPRPCHRLIRDARHARRRGQSGRPSGRSSPRARRAASTRRRLRGVSGTTMSNARSANMARASANVSRETSWMAPAARNVSRETFAASAAIHLRKCHRFRPVPLGGASADGACRDATLRLPMPGGVCSIRFTFQVVPSHGTAYRPGQMGVRPAGAFRV